MRITNSLLCSLCWQHQQQQRQYKPWRLNPEGMQSPCFWFAEGLGSDEACTERNLHAWLESKDSCSSQYQAVLSTQKCLPYVHHAMESPPSSPCWPSQFRFLWSLLQQIPILGLRKQIRIQMRGRSEEMLVPLESSSMACFQERVN